jgi:acyl-CoA dehydrogenase
MASGEVLAAIGMTESGAGSGLKALRTTAMCDGDEYVINGSKTFITNGGSADMMLLAAKTDPKAGAQACRCSSSMSATPGFEVTYRRRDGYRRGARVRGPAD